MFKGQLLLDMQDIGTIALLPPFIAALKIKA